VWILDFVRELKRSKAARDKATRERKRAEFELERHQATLIALWGNRYRKHPEYEKAVSQVARGRTASFALADWLD
jgi:hypothetical protein